MRIKILITIFLIIFGAVTYFAYPVVKNRYLEPTDIIEQEELLNDRKNFINPDGTESDNNSDNSETLPDEQPVDEDVFIEIDQEDCEDNCEQFEDADDKKYCQQYCSNTAETNSINDTDCEKLEDLEKDYCYKNQALTKKDFSLCKKISDKKLSEACKNQLTESILNGGGVSE